jgi:hypothetical protein
MRSEMPSSSVQSTRSGLRISRSDIAVIWPAVTSPGPSARNVRRFGPSACRRKRDLLHVQHDVGDVFAHARNRGELVQHASIWIAVTAAP